MQDAPSLFKKHFNHTPTHLVQAPGRLEVLGNHTDYNNGLVMAVAVDKYIHIAAAPRNDGKVELVSTAFPAPELFSVSDIKPNPANPRAPAARPITEGKCSASASPTVVPSKRDSEKRPSVYFRLGIRSEEAGSVYPLHHPKFRVDETALAIGATTLVETAKRFLARDAGSA